MRKLSDLRLTGFWSVTIAAIIWGTIGIATQAIYNIGDTSPLFINLMRVLVATPILLLMCWRAIGRKLLIVQPRDLGLMLISGVFLVLSQVAYFTAIQFIGVTISTLLTLCVSPIIVVVLSLILRTESLTKRLLIALAFALLGCVLLIGIHSPDDVREGLLLGTIWSLGSAFCYACTLMCGRFLADKYHPLHIISISFSAGTVLLLSISLMSGFVVTQTTETWLLLVYLALVPTVLAYWLFQIGLGSVKATTASIVIMLDPLVTAFLAWLMFGETLSSMGMIGAALLIASLFLLSQSNPKQAKVQSI